MRPPRLNAGAARAFIESETRVLAPPLAPELRFHGVDDATRLWSATEDALEEIGLPPPFWAFAWPGGQALARLLLDQPERAAGRRVIALAAGAGLEAIAAAKAGAASVVANDIDPVACAAARLNSELNAVRVETDARDLLDGSTQSAAALAEADLLLVGDAFYERPLTERLAAAVEAACAGGAEALIGDAGRGGDAAAPFVARCEVLAEFRVAASLDLEGVDERRVRVLRRAAGRRDAGR